MNMTCKAEMAAAAKAEAAALEKTKKQRAKDAKRREKEEKKADVAARKAERAEKKRQAKRLEEPGEGKLSAKTRMISTSRCGGHSEPVSSLQAVVVRHVYRLPLPSMSLCQRGDCACKCTCGDKGRTCWHQYKIICGKSSNQ